MKSKRDEKIMFILLDEVSLSGLFSLDGYIDARSLLPREVAIRILERL